MKRCSRCKQIKSLDDFHRNRSKHDGVNSYCKQCMKEYDKQHGPEYRQRPEVRERRREYEREYSKRPRQAERIRNYHREYYRKPEQRRKRREYYRKNRNDPQKRAAKKIRMKAYRQRPDVKCRNTIHARQRYHRKIEQSRERGRLSSARRRARHQRAKGKHTAQEFRVMCRLVDNRCVSCGKKTRLQRDHIIPLVKGGCDCIHNIQPLCRSCNSSKKDYHMTDYRPQQVFDWLDSLPATAYRCTKHFLPTKSVMHTPRVLQYRLL